MGSQDIVLENIRKLMKIKGFSSNRLADFAGIPRTYMAALLREESIRPGGEPHSMTLKTLDKIADALEVEAVELMQKLDE